MTQVCPTDARDGAWTTVQARAANLRCPVHAAPLEQLPRCYHVVDAVIEDAVEAPAWVCTIAVALARIRACLRAGPSDKAAALAMELTALLAECGAERDAL